MMSSHVAFSGRLSSSLRASSSVMVSSDIDCRRLAVFGFSFVCGTLPECAAGPGVEASFLALGIAFVLSQIAGGLLFLYGFATVLAARLEFGPDHVRHVERARVFLSLTVVLLLVGFFAPFLLIPSSPPGTPAREPIFSVLAGPIPSAVAALFAGLVLLDILHRFSTHRDRLGLGAALVLGVAGAAVEGFSVYPGSGVLPAWMVSLPLGLNLLSQAIVAASLLLFLLVYRRIGQKFRTGQFQRSWPPGFPASSGLLPEVPVRPPTPPLGP